MTLVTMSYRRLGTTHVFSSIGIEGLVHVGHHDMHHAYRAAGEALALHLSVIGDARVVCRPVKSFDEFVSAIADPELLGSFVDFEVAEAA